jgi:hypothetical protein
VGRDRVYESSAERQRAYRLRLAAQHPRQERMPTGTRRRPSRPARLTELRRAADDLRQEYQTWLESLPETLQDSCQATKLAETIEQLEAVVELLAEIQPAKGFGRD